MAELAAAVLAAADGFIGQRLVPHDAERAAARRADNLLHCVVVADLHPFVTLRTADVKAARSLRRRLSGNAVSGRTVTPPPALRLPFLQLLQQSRARSKTLQAGGEVWRRPPAAASFVLAGDQIVRQLIQGAEIRKTADVILQQRAIRQRRIGRGGVAARVRPMGDGDGNGVVQTSVAPTVPQVDGDQLLENLPAASVIGARSSFTERRHVRLPPGFPLRFKPVAQVVEAVSHRNHVGLMSIRFGLHAQLASRSLVGKSPECLSQTGPPISRDRACRGFRAQPQSKKTARFVFSARGSGPALRYPN